jgi:hypothetical integral membrane protein (TIGR02206 family)
LPPRFEPFGALHAVTIAIVLVVIAGVIVLARRGPVTRAHAIGRGLGLGLLVYYALDTAVRVAYLGVPLAHNLPFEICNALFFIAAFALYRRHRVALEVTYLWAFAATLHALITPTPGEGFPSVEYVRYFAAHGLLVLAGAYALLGLDVPIGGWSILRASIALQLLEGIVAVVDLVFDQNFMYLRRPPPSPTLIDSLGPWPIYLVSLELVGIASFALWTGVAVLVRRWLPRRDEAHAEPSDAAMPGDTRAASDRPGA